MNGRHWLRGSAALALTSLALAACGGSAGGSGSAPAPAPSDATVTVAGTDLGNVLVDSSGRTVYLFKKDSAGKSACTGACAAAWPPLAVSGSPTPGSGVDAGMLGTTTGAGGTNQLTYNGHPLYTFSGDGKPGETKGEAATAFGGEWYAVSPTGDAVQKAKSGGGYGGY